MSDHEYIVQTEDLSADMNSTRDMIRKLEMNKGYTDLVLEDNRFSENEIKEENLIYAIGNLENTSIFRIVFFGMLSSITERTIDSIIGTKIVSVNLELGGPSLDFISNLPRLTRENQLRELVIIDNEGMIMEIWKENPCLIPGPSHKLGSFTMKHIHLPIRSMLKVVDLIESSPNIEYLTLVGCNLDESLLLRILGGNTAKIVTNLTLSACKLNDRCMNILVEKLIKDNSPLKFLDVSMNTDIHDAKPFIKAIRTLTNFRELDVTNCNIPDEKRELIAHWFRVNGKPLTRTMLTIMASKGTIPKEQSPINMLPQELVMRIGQKFIGN